MDGQSDEPAWQRVSRVEGLFDALRCLGAVRKGPLQASYLIIASPSRLKRAN